MSRLNWVFFAAFASAVIMNSISAAQRDSALAEIGQLQSLYNGVLIGRGCELPK